MIYEIVILELQLKVKIVYISGILKQKTPPDCLIDCEDIYGHRTLLVPEFQSDHRTDYS